MVCLVMRLTHRDSSPESQALSVFDGLWPVIRAPWENKAGKGILLLVTWSASSLNVDADNTVVCSGVYGLNMIFV